MKQLEQFFLLIDQCLNDTEFIRKHALSEKDFTRNRILTFRNTFLGGGYLHILVLLYKVKYHC